MMILHSDLMNLDTLKAELVRYHDTGKYLAQIAEINHQAENYLTDRVNENKNLAHPRKLAVVFDIDETSLSNYPYMSKMDFGGTAQDFINAQAKAKDPVIQPTLELFKLAEKDHVAVFFVTGRPEDLRSATVKNLDAAGYFAYNGLYLCPENYKKTSIIPFKSDSRKQIEAKGYDVVLDIGDQESDLLGGYADRKFKLPNPYYYVA